MGKRTVEICNQRSLFFLFEVPSHVFSTLIFFWFGERARPLCGIFRGRCSHSSSFVVLLPLRKTRSLRFVEVNQFIYATVFMPLHSRSVEEHMGCPRTISDLPLLRCRDQSIFLIFISLVFLIFSSTNFPNLCFTTFF